MTDLALRWTLSTSALLGIAAAAVVALLVLIMRLRLHAFLALLIVSLGTAVATGIPADRLLATLLSGFGTTLASVALLVALGAMLGRLLEVSGGAQVLTDALLQRVGEGRAPIALGIASLLFGFPIFFDAGLVVMLPIIFSVARRMGGSLLRYAFPSAVAFSVMHVFVPPHPGPVAASGLLEADVGLVLLFGLVIAIPTWGVVGLWFGRRVASQHDVPVPATITMAEQQDARARPLPSLLAILALLALPLVLIFLNTGLNTLATAGVVSRTAEWVQVLRLVGETPIALLITVLVAIAWIGGSTAQGAQGVDRVLEGALGPVCSVILITGAGGMFGGVLRASGIGAAVAATLTAAGLPVIVAGFVMAALMRFAQGSATVALTTAAALVQPAVLGATAFSPVQRAAIVLSLAAGSVFAGHVNDSGFWLVSRFFGMSPMTTLKTWTVGQALIGVMGFGMALAIYQLAGLY